MPENMYHKAFSRLSIEELYDLLALRQAVFIVEQNCPYLDADYKDQACEHILQYDKDNQLVAYARLVPMGVSYEKYCSIGRVITSKKIRGRGAGKKLMQYTINVSKKLFPNQAIKISAQVYALEFYERLGFITVGEEYLEDDIPHKAMVLTV